MTEFKTIPFHADLITSFGSDAVSEMLVHQHFADTYTVVTDSNRVGTRYSCESSDKSLKDLQYWNRIESTVLDRHEPSSYTLNDQSQSFPGR